MKDTMIGYCNKTETQRTADGISSQELAFYVYASDSHNFISLFSFWHESESEKGF